MQSERKKYRETKRNVKEENIKFYYANYILLDEQIFNFDWLNPPPLPGKPTLFELHQK